MKKYLKKGLKILAIILLHLISVIYISATVSVVAYRAFAITNKTIENNPSATFEDVLRAIDEELGK